MSFNVYDYFSKEKVNHVIEHAQGDIDESFVGFTNQYKYLSLLIPKHWTVIDFGCGYNPQCVFFNEHKKLISIDTTKHRFHANLPNHYNVHGTIKEWINQHMVDIDVDTTFAICSYVASDEVALVRKHFKNMFIFYPHY